MKLPKFFAGKNHKVKWLSTTVRLTLNVLFCTALFITISYADSTGTTPNLSIGGVASTVIVSMKELARLITAGAYVAGFGFAIGAILKFKAHKDNPTQIPVGTPIALIFIAAALIFMPSIFGVAGKTVFGTTSAAVGGVSGVASF